MAHFTVKWYGRRIGDDRPRDHWYEFGERELPRVGDTIEIRGNDLRVTAVKHKPEEGSITVLTEPVKSSL